MERGKRTWTDLSEMCAPFAYLPEVLPDAWLNIMWSAPIDPHMETFNEYCPEEGT